MPKRPITAVAAALALLAAAPSPSLAQEPPTGASPAVKRIYEDYADNGRIDVCDHKRADLQKALETIEPDFNRDNPDFRAALQAGIQRHDRGRCGTEEPAVTPTATPTPVRTPTATATARPDKTPTPESGSLPETGGDGGGGAAPPENGTLPPSTGQPAPSVTPPPAATPTAAPPAAAVTPTASPTPVVVTRSESGGLLVPAILLGIALLGALGLGGYALAARRSPSLNHAWREAALRSRATWADFSDWLRLGR